MTKSLPCGLPLKLPSISIIGRDGSSGVGHTRNYVCRRRCRVTLVSMLLRSVLTKLLQFGSILEQKSA